MDRYKALLVLLVAATLTDCLDEENTVHFIEWTREGVQQYRPPK